MNFAINLSFNLFIDYTEIVWEAHKYRDTNRKKSDTDDTNVICLPCLALQNCFYLSISIVVTIFSKPETSFFVDNVKTGGRGEKRRDTCNGWVSLGVRTLTEPCDYDFGLALIQTHFPNCLLAIDFILGSESVQTVTQISLFTLDQTIFSIKTVGLKDFCDQMYWTICAMCIARC